MLHAPRYRSTITSASLRVADSRVIAGLLLESGNSRSWKCAIVEENVLQIQSPKAALSIAGVLRARLQLMKPTLLELVLRGSYLVATHACFAAAIKHSQLLGDYLDLVLREKYRLFAPALTRSDWDRYVEDCKGRDPEMIDWSDTTVARLRSIVHGMLAQMGYVDSVYTLQLQTVHVAREVLDYLEKEQEQYVLRCMTVHP